MIASLRRLDYTAIRKTRDIHPDRANPSSDLFDPERAAVLHARNLNFDEAIWLIFLSVHFGKHGTHGWRMLRDVYSGLGSGLWSWARVSAQPDDFRRWLKANRADIGGAFGNHRKYETLDADSASLLLRRQSRIALDPIGRCQADRCLGRRSGRRVGLTELHVEPHLVIGYVAAGHKAVPPHRKNHRHTRPTATTRQTPLETGAAPAG